MLLLSFLYSLYNKTFLMLDKLYPILSFNMKTCPLYLVGKCDFPSSPKLRSGIFMPFVLSLP